MQRRAGRRPARGRPARGRPAPPDLVEPRAAGTPAAEDRDPDPVEAARGICLRLLTGAPRTRAQLADALARRGVDEAVAERVLDRLTEVGLIDDASYAVAWVHSRHTGRGLARRALAAELRRRGVDAEDVDAAVDQLDPEQELATATALARRRQRQLDHLPADVQARRLAGMLARKGYPPGLAYRVVAEVTRDGAEELMTAPEVDGWDGAGED